MYSQKFDSEKRLFKFCPSSWGHKESDTAEQLTDNNIFIHWLAKQTSCFFYFPGNPSGFCSGFSLDRGKEFILVGIFHILFWNSGGSTTHTQTYTHTHTPKLSFGWVSSQNALEVSCKTWFLPHCDEPPVLTCEFFILWFFLLPSSLDSLSPYLIL